MAPIIGIDLGTTNSLAAYMREGVPTIIPSAEGNVLVPSVIAFSEAGEIIVGEHAKRMRITQAERTIYSVKRLMGRARADVENELSLLPYDVLDRGEGGVYIQVGGRNYTPPELSALILRQLREQAEAALGEPISQAVITVPAYFNDTQRQATKDAGKIAGLEVMRIVNEPTAAALAYGLHRRQAETVAVYDLGGGTFDISILKLRDGIFEVLATNGDTRLGGDDLDRRLMERLGRNIKETTGVDLLCSPEGLERLRTAAEAVKCQLSSTPEASTEVLLGPDHPSFDFVLTRADFEEEVRDILERTLPPCRQAMTDAGLDATAIDAVVLVGGSTRIVLVQQLVEELFGRPPHVDMNPDEVVGLGAAVQADILAGGQQDLLLLDVIPLSLGIETIGGVTNRIIERNTTVPTQASEMFTTFVDGQTSVDIRVLQGEREMAVDNRSLAEFQLRGIPPMPAGLARVQVTFTVDANGILRVAACELKTNTSQEVVVKPSYGLTEAEVDRMVRDSFEYAESDIRQRLLTEARNEADLILRATRKALARGTTLSRTERQTIARAIGNTEEAMKGDNHQDILRAVETLNQATEDLAHQIMDSAVRDALSDRSVDKVAEAFRVPNKTSRGRDGAEL